jgi:hypothetical protein
MRLNLASLAASVAVLMSTFSLGCGTDCESTCEKARESGCGHQWAKQEQLDPDQGQVTSGDCASLCEDIEARNEAAECVSQFDEYIGCLNDQRSVCDINSCESEVIRHSTCVVRYCLEHPGGPCPP